MDWMKSPEVWLDWRLLGRGSNCTPFSHEFPFFPSNAAAMPLLARLMWLIPNIYSNYPVLALLESQI